MNRIDELAAELRRYIDDLAQWREDDNEALHTAAWDSAILTVDALAQAAQGAPEWRPIVGAPKDGTEILSWREDCGTLLIRWTSPEEFLSDKEISEGCEHVGDDAWVFQHGWFCADFVAGSRLEGCEVPTLWQPLPAAPVPGQPKTED